METEINGIIHKGKVYIPDYIGFAHDCDECDMDEKTCRAICGFYGMDCIFRFSPELTEKLKGK